MLFDELQVLHAPVEAEDVSGALDEQVRQDAGIDEVIVDDQAAAFFRFSSSRASTKVTVASIEGWLRPFC
jgi:hypothetical protein